MQPTSDQERIQALQAEVTELDSLTRTTPTLVHGPGYAGYFCELPTG